VLEMLKRMQASRQRLKSSKTSKMTMINRWKWMLMLQYLRKKMMKSPPLSKLRRNLLLNKRRS